MLYNLWFLLFCCIKTASSILICWLARYSGFVYGRQLVAEADVKFSYVTNSGYWLADLFKADSCNWWQMSHYVTWRHVMSRDITWRHVNSLLPADLRIEVWREIKSGVIWGLQMQISALCDILSQTCQHIIPKYYHFETFISFLFLDIIFLIKVV